MSAPRSVRVGPYTGQTRTDGRQISGSSQIGLPFSGRASFTCMSRLHTPFLAQPGEHPVRLQGRERYVESTS
jgi:hypothetical protein